MRSLLSAVVVVCITVVASASILWGPLPRVHLTGSGNNVLMPAGDDNGGGH